ncbi:MAG: hypothetical protein K9L56_14050 [Clostridiales bacterium]|nr:hypothetical protein [Clostridiales bacterium]
MFNQGGFNNLGFNERTTDFHVSKQDSVDVKTTEETSSSVEVSASDNINVIINESVFFIPSSQGDIITPIIDESIDIYRETSGLDPPTINVLDVAKTKVYINASDTLNVTDDLVVKYGFNQQGFNQAETTYKVTIDNTEVDATVLDTDSTNLDITEKGIDREQETSGAIKPSINDYNGLSKPEYVNDNININITETSNVQVLNDVSDSLVVSERNYLPLGFNQQKFNQPQQRYFLETEKTILNTNINPNDSLPLTIDIGTDYDTDVYALDNTKVSFYETVSLDKPVNLVDNIDLTLQESADVSVKTEVSDSIDLTYDFIGYLGFNQQKFNQGKDYYIYSGENSTISLFQADVLTANISDYSILESLIKPVDSLKLNSTASRKWSKATIDAQESLNTVINDTRALDKPEHVYDTIETNIFSYSDLQVLFNRDDTALVTVTSTERATSTLMYLINEEWRHIVRGYVLVNGE